MIPFTIAYLKTSLQDTASLAQLAASTSSGSVLKNFSLKTVEVAQERVEKATQTSKKSVAVASLNKNSLHSFIQESDIPELVSNVPLLIVWKQAVQFLDSFKNPGDVFHIMLWAFVIVAAWETM